MKTHGLHHITAIASGARRNIQFYTGVLGLRLVKKTVNFDDPGTYHFYYGDSVGTPGSILTFFPWADLPRGRPGAGQATATAFSVPAGSIPFWQKRLAAHKVVTRETALRFGDEVLSFDDPDGLQLELVAPPPASAADQRESWTHPDIPAAHAIRGFHHTTLSVHDGKATAKLLTETMGFREHAREGNRIRYTADGAPAPGTFADIVADPALPHARQGAGTVHHVAFRVKNSDDELAARDELTRLGLNVSPQMERYYFKSVYYREPAGILFELATDAPGFAADESVEKLGSALKLPPQYEPHRAQIEASLPKLV